MFVNLQFIQNFSKQLLVKNIVYCSQIWAKKKDKINKNENLRNNHLRV